MITYLLLFAYLGIRNIFLLKDIDGLEFEKTGAAGSWGSVSTCWIFGEAFIIYHGYFVG